jgi:hypothetical protein
LTSAISLVVSYHLPLVSPPLPALLDARPRHVDHDEILLEAPEALAQAAADLLLEVMDYPASLPATSGMSSPWWLRSTWERAGPGLIDELTLRDDLGLGLTYAPMIRAKQAQRNDDGTAMPW